MSGASDLANDIASSLLAGTDFAVPLPDFSGDDYQLPEVDPTSALYGPIPRLTNADFTVGDNSTSGSGTFDVLMKGLRAHLKNEYENNRISGAEYTKAYIACTEAAMQNSTQFLLGRDSAYWQAVGAQIQAQTAQVALVTARVQLESEKTKLQVLRLDALNQQITYALNKIRLASESVNFDSAKYNLDNLLPQQLALGVKNLTRADTENANLLKQGIQLDKQSQLADKQISLAQTELDQAPAKLQLITKQIVGQDNQNTLVSKQSDQIQKDIDLAPDKRIMLLRQIASQEAQTTLLGKQGAQIDNEIALQPYKISIMKEQVETARAQTLDTRSDGTAITGSVGKQRDLYAQQIISYKRDAEVKVVKIFSDAWVTMKTIDEGLDPPLAFANTNLDEVLNALKTNIGL